ncbi:uncharacterized protein LOC143073057 [Mytilus galloprovincialis]|uniref:uncharacterized protein LOC143073057 n=1 Tax=Mytilus galloprovincialis TaxID=29158 RepID=UPI003F7C19B7
MKIHSLPVDSTQSTTFFGPKCLGMTRFTKLTGGQRKRPEESTKWEDLKKNQQNTDRSSETRQRNYGRASSEIHHRQGASCGKSRDGFKLKKFGFSDEKEKELFTMLKKETRSDNRRVKRIKKKQDEKVCYNCREPGHNMSECPTAKKDIEHGTGICFKCGSTEHSSSSCRVKVKPGDFPYAKCFICGETGHLSKQCPDNPKGLYPMGGCCKECGSVEHYVKDCPEAHAKLGIDSVTLPTLDNFTSADAEEELVDVRPQTVKKKVPKMVKF